MVLSDSSGSIQTSYSFITDKIYTMSWYQPKWNVSYDSNSLRRYSGNENSNDAEYV